jgi:hypothetical protein
MANTLRSIQAISVDGELHCGDGFLGSVVYGFNPADGSGYGSEFMQSADARAEITVHGEIDLWKLLQDNAQLTLRLNDGSLWECRVGRINDLLLGKHATLAGRRSRQSVA